MIVSDQATSEAVMRQYLEELKEITEDLYKQALTSVLSELADVTGISDFVKGKQDDLKKMLEGYVEILQKNGYGDILSYIKRARDWYDLTQKLAAVKNAGDINESMKSAKSVYDKIKDMDYSDSAVKNTIVSGAMDKISSAGEELENALYNYVYGTEEGKQYLDQRPWYEKAVDFVHGLFQCPVDFEVYDSAGTRIGYVLDGEVYYTDDIFIEVRGDVKSLYVPKGMDVNLKLIPTDYGTMNYVIEEVSGGAAVGRLNYYDIPLVSGNDYTQTITSSSTFNDVTSLPIQTSDSKSISANEYLAATDETANVTISIVSDEGGVTTGAGTYPKGDSVELIAYPLSDTYKFAGWYAEDVLVGIEEVYRFTALDDITVRANFSKRKTLNATCDVTMGTDYAESAWVSIYDCADGTETVSISSLSSDETTDFSSISVKKYDQSGKCISEGNTTTSFDGHSSYWIDNFSLENSSKVELYDSTNVCIATITVTRATVISGDANGDNKINNRDVILLQQYLSGWEAANFDSSAADTDGNGKVNNRDVIRLQQYLSGWNVTLGGGEATLQSFSYSPSLQTMFAPLKFARAILFGGSAAEITVEDAVVRAGETVDIAVMLKNNPGLNAYRFGVRYDADKLELLNVKDGDYANVPAPFNGSLYTFNWADGTAMTDKTGDTAGIMTFRVRDDAVGSADFEIVIFDEEDFSNVAGDVVSFTAGGGSLTVV